MKCPKCGYNSFEYLDQCKKCGNDLVSFKQSNGILSVLFPAVAQESVSAGIPASEVPENRATEPAGGGAFQWDEPAAEPAEVLPDFSFNEAPAEAESDLGDLLESSASLERTATAAGGGDGMKGAEASTAGFEAVPGEFELGDFLGDGKESSQAEPTKPQTAPPAELDGDFDFLFKNDEENK